MSNVRLLMHKQDGLGNWIPVTEEDFPSDQMAFEDIIDTPTTLSGYGITDGVSLTGSGTLTNKAISLGSNTIAGSKAQFNTAVTDANFAFVDAVNSFTENQTFSSFCSFGDLAAAVLEATTGTIGTLSADNLHVYNLNVLEEGGLLFYSTTERDAWRTALGITASSYTFSTGLTETSGVVTVNASQPQITGVGTLTSGTWNASVVTGQYGGTGVANTGKTITVGANFLTTGTSGVTLAAPSTGSPIVYTLPTTAATLARRDSGQTFLGAQTFADLVTFSSDVEFSGPIGATSITVSGTADVGLLACYSLHVNEEATLSFHSSTEKESWKSSLGIPNLSTTGTSGITLAAPSTGSPIVYTLPTTAATLARKDAAQTFTGTQTFGAIVATSISADSVSGEIDAGNITSGIINTSILGTDGDDGLFLRHDSSWALPANCYTINLSSTSSSPLDGATNYFANFVSTPTTTASNYRIYISRNSRILSAEICSYASTAGTSESWPMYIRVNNTTDYLITSLISGSNTRRWTNTSLSIDLSAGDYFEIKMVNPTWATNPLGAIFAGYVYLLAL